MSRYLEALGWAGLQLLCPFVHRLGPVAGYGSGQGTTKQQAVCQASWRVVWTRHHLGYESPVDIQKLKPLNGLGDLESPSKGSAPRRREAWMGGGAESRFSALEPWANDCTFQNLS